MIADEMQRLQAQFATHSEPPPDEPDGDAPPPRSDPSRSLDGLFKRVSDDELTPPLPLLIMPPAGAAPPGALVAAESVFGNLF